MFKQIRNIYQHFLKYKKKQYLNSLVTYGLKMGHNVTIMDGFFIDPTHCFLISIGDYCVLAPNVRLIAHDASMKQILGYTKVGKVTIEANCFLGDSVIVTPGVTIGQGSIVGAGSVVTHDIPAETISVGNPCTVISKRNVFLQKHEKEIVSRIAPFANLEQLKLTNSQKSELCKFLDSGMGYIK